MQISSTMHNQIDLMRPAAGSMNSSQASSQGKSNTAMEMQLSKIASKGFKDPQDIRVSVKEAIEQLSKKFSNSDNSLAISIDKSLTLPIVSVHNSQTGELVRKIPNETLIKVAHTLENLKGLLWDEKS